MGPSTGRDLCAGMASAVAEILTAKSFCMDSRGNSLKSSMDTGEEGCHAAYIKVIIFWRDSWMLPASTACGEAGNSVVSSSLCHKIFSLKYLSTAASDEFTETPCSPDRQATGKLTVSCYRVKKSSNNCLCDWK